MRGLMYVLLCCFFFLPVHAVAKEPVIVLPQQAVSTEELASGKQCGDFLDFAAIKPADIEFLFCRPGLDVLTQRPALIARYRVKGEKAAAVEKALHQQTDMALLQRQGGIWQLEEGGEGSFLLQRREKKEEQISSAPRCVVRMGEVPQQGTVVLQRDEWERIPWFSVTVLLWTD